MDLLQYYEAARNSFVIGNSCMVYISGEIHSQATPHGLSHLLGKSLSCSVNLFGIAEKDRCYTHTHGFGQNFVIGCFCPELISILQKNRK